MAEDIAAQLAANRRLWDEWTQAHLTSKFYDVESFKAGRISLYPLEVEALGDVRGKRLVHLQCHFGLDTMSWARLGAEVTGVDFSEKAIEAARQLAAEIGVEARFICSDVTRIEEPIGPFDVVYTGGGAIGWLPDLDAWARVVASLLAPGGTFYLREFHPFAWVFDDAPGLERPGAVGYRYFPGPEPIVSPVEGSYADPEADIKEPSSYGWPHSFEELFTVLIGNGLRITELREYPFVGEKIWPWLEQRDDGYWYARGCDLPLMFGLKAVKDE